MTVKKQFNSFEELITGSKLPVLVDFYATWCGPCQLMAQILEQINPEISQKVQIVKIDTDKYPQLASQFQIQALPTLVLFKDGQAIQRIEGVMQPPHLLQQLQNLV